MVLDEDVLVVADAVLDGVHQTVGHGPSRRLVERDRRDVVDPGVQLEIRVAAVGDHRLSLRQQVSTEAHALVVRLDEQVDELVAADREVGDRRTIDDGDPRLEPGFGQEPIVELLPGARRVGGPELAGEQLRGVGAPEAAVVIVRDGIGIVGGRRADLERDLVATSVDLEHVIFGHLSMLAAIHRLLRGPRSMVAAMGIPRPTRRDHLGLARLASRDIAGLLDRLHENWGPVVDVGFRFPLRAVYLFGPEANRLILHDQVGNFRWGEAMSTLVPVNGPTALVVTDGEEHDRRRRLVQPAFSRRRVDAHLDLIVAEADRLLATWTSGRSLDAFAEGRRAVRRIAVRSLFGSHLSAEADRIGELLEPALRYVNSNPATRIDVDLGFNGYARARRARLAVDEIVQVEIDRQRASGIDDDDPGILSALLAGSPGDDALADHEIRDQVRSLIAAGYDTTSSALSWLVYGLGSNPAAFDALVEQVRTIVGDRPPSIEDLRQMPLVDGVVRETLRLWPPGAASVRTAVESFECRGHRIEPGTLVVYSPYVTHRLADVWEDPLGYRPERWRHGEPEPYSYVPFGGGRRNCIGFTLATLELQVFAVRLAQSCRWTVETREPRSAAAASFAPTGGMPITIA